MSLFATESTPALSFKDAPVGTSYTGVVTRAPELVQSRDIDTGELAYWPANPDGSRNPKMSVVLNITMPTGEERSVWATKPSQLYSALGAAEKAAGAAIAIGGTLTITLTGEKPNATNPKLNAQKLYTATYAPGSAFAEQPAATPASAPAPQTAAPAPQAPAVQAAEDQLGKVTKARTLLAAGIDPATVATATGLSPEVVAALAAQS